MLNAVTQFRVRIVASGTTVLANICGEYLKTNSCNVTLIYTRVYSLLVTKQNALP